MYWIGVVGDYVGGVCEFVLFVGRLDFVGGGGKCIGLDVGFVFVWLVVIGFFVGCFVVVVYDLLFVGMG